jgi:hypothetical protein
MRKARTIARRHFPPWQIVELQDGYAVEDAGGRRLSAFHVRTDPGTAERAGGLTVEEARQMAFDFAAMPELLKRFG